MPVKKDILVRLGDCHKKAITEFTHTYTASVIDEAMKEISRLRTKLVITREMLADEMVKKNK